MSSPTTTVAGSSQKQPSRAEVMGELQRLKSIMTDLASKVNELEQERDEHQLVIQTLKPLDPNRKAFRLVSGVLVERTVKEVLPAVETNMEGLKTIISQLQQQLKKRDDEILDIQKKYGDIINAKA